MHQETFAKAIWTIYDGKDRGVTEEEIEEVKKYYNLSKKRLRIKNTHPNQVSIYAYYYAKKDDKNYFKK